MAATEALLQMFNLIDGVPTQVAQALSIARSAAISRLTQAPDNVLICGLGGSGIGGSIAAEFALPLANVPLLVCKDYDLPHFVSERSLVIACSYSGTTEETLACVNSALNVGANVFCISSGGALIELARTHNLEHIIIPGGQPPRASLGYSLVSLLVALEGKGILPAGSLTGIEEVADALSSQKHDLMEEAKRLAQLIKDKHIVLYAPAGLEAVAVRWRQQINENAKLLCHHHVVPEMNHNELVGWAGGNDSYAVLFLRSHGEHPRNAIRMGINSDVIRRYTPTVLDVRAHGEGLIELFSMIYLGDWVSYYLAEQSGTDPIEIEVINYLKNTLATA